MKQQQHPGGSPAGIGGQFKAQPRQIVDTDLCSQSEKFYVVIDRQYGPGVAVAYPDKATAERALISSPLVDSLCEEDCLDAYVEGTVPEGYEEIVPDNDDGESWMPCGFGGDRYSPHCVLPEGHEGPHWPVAL